MLREINNFRDFLDHYAATKIYAFVRCHWEPVCLDGIFDADTIISKLSIIEEYKDFVSFILDFLYSKAFFSKDGNHYKISDSSSLDSYSIKDFDSYYQECKDLILLIDHCVNNYDKLFIGKIRPISVLYPDGNTNFLSKHLESYIIKHSSLKKHITKISNLINFYQTLGKGKILEIGAGQGHLTWDLLTHLSSSDYIEYHLTDISRTLVIQAENRAASIKHSCSLYFHTFDITKSATSQGLEFSNFDYIIGLDVIHATRNVKESISNLKNLLTKNGHLILIESIPTCWLTCIWGCLPSWWIHDDKYRKRGAGPLLSKNKWEQVLLACDLKSTEFLPNEVIDLSLDDFNLIIAQKAAYA